MKQLSWGAIFRGAQFSGHHRNYWVLTNAFWIRLRFVKYRFMRYRFVRYWFKFAGRPWLNADIPSKHFFLSKASSRHLQDMSSRRLEDMSFRRPQDMSSRRLQCNNFLSSKMSSKHLQDVLEDEKLLRWRRVEDVFKTCLEDVLKTNKCLLGYYI